MRTSIAAVALIRREEGGQTLWLAQWNRKWGAYHLIGGHKKPDESFRECAIREVTEELHLEEGRDFSVADEPLAHLEFTALSESARVETAYMMELFPVELIGAARRKVDADPENRWLTAAEVEARQAADARPISKTMAFVLRSAALLPK